VSLVASLFGHPLVETVVHIAGLAFLAGVVTALSAFVYRIRARTQFPEGPTLILGLGAVAIYLNTRLIFVQFIGDTGDPLTVSEALLNISVFVTAGFASYVGRYAGDSVGTSDRLNWSVFQPDFNPIVRAVGRVITVTLPEEIDDIDGYDPVRDETKRAIAGTTLEFPRGLTVGDLQSQLVARLKEDHDVGYVDVDLTADGTVEFLAVGQRAAGIGPTLPPNSAAVAVRSDPPFSATAGDTVQLWRTDSDGKQTRLGTAELRASVDDVTTVATDEAIADRVDPTVDYRLMTFPADTHADREFAAMLRRGDETMSIVEITAESPLVGASVAALDATIIAIRSADGDVATIPKRDRRIGAGEQLFAIGRPDTLRKLEAASGVRSIAESETPLAADSAIDWESDTGSSRNPLTYDGE
jgi:hypothetical protein